MQIFTFQKNVSLLIKVWTLLCSLQVLSAIVLELNPDPTFTGLKVASLDGTKTDEPLSISQEELFLVTDTDHIPLKSDSGSQDRPKTERGDVVYMIYQSAEDKLIYKDGSGNSDNIAKGDLVLFVGPSKPVRFPVWAGPKIDLLGDFDRRLEILSEAVTIDPSFMEKYDMKWSQLPMEPYTEDFDIETIVEKMNDNKSALEKGIKADDMDSGLADYKRVDKLMSLTTPDPEIDIGAFKKELSENILKYEPAVDYFVAKRAEFKAAEHKFQLRAEVVRQALIKLINEEEDFFGEYPAIKVAIIQKYLNELLSSEENMFFNIVESMVNQSNHRRGYFQNKMTAFLMVESYIKNQFRKNDDLEDFPQLKAFFEKIKAVYDSEIQYSKGESEFAPIQKEMETYYTRKWEETRFHTLSYFAEFSGTQRRELFNNLMTYMDQSMMTDAVPKFREPVWVNYQVIPEGLIHLLLLVGRAPSDYCRMQTDPLNFLIIRQEEVVKVETKGKKKKIKDGPTKGANKNSNGSQNSSASKLSKNSTQHLII